MGEAAMEVTPPTVLRQGDSSLTLIEWLAQSIPRLESMSFKCYRPEPGFAERLSDDGLSYPQSFVQNVLRHEPDAPPWFLASHDITAKRLQESLDGLGPGTALAFCSSARVHGRLLHIPMIDFNIGENPRMPRVLVEGMRGLGVRQGAILFSGHSYHGYGFAPIERVEWRRFLHRSLLLPQVDSRHVAHRLLEDSSMLRISSHRLTKNLPKIECVWP